MSWIVRTLACSASALLIASAINPGRAQMARLGVIRPHAKVGPMAIFSLTMTDLAAPLVRLELKDALATMMGHPAVHPPMAGAALKDALAPMVGAVMREGLVLKVEVVLATVVVWMELEALMAGAALKDDLVLVVLMVPAAGRHDLAKIFSRCASVIRRCSISFSPTWNWEGTRWN